MAADNKLVMYRFLEFINTASEKLAQKLISPNAVFHVPGRTEPMRGPAGYLAIIGMMRGGFPDFNGRWRRLLPRATRSPRGSPCEARIGVPSSASRRQERQSRCRP